MRCERLECVGGGDVARQSLPVRIAEVNFTAEDVNVLHSLAAIELNTYRILQPGSPHSNTRNWPPSDFRLSLTVTVSQYSNHQSGSVGKKINTYLDPTSKARRNEPP